MIAYLAKIDQLFVLCQPRLSVEWDAFEDSSQGKEATTSWNRIPLRGSVSIMNTVEAFKVPLHCPSPQSFFSCFAGSG